MLSKHCTNLPLFPILITKGFRTQEIAERMQLSPLTVKTLVRRIYGSLR
ncbi:LuxR C-terminal-related transcriptional regulator [Paraburkholderia sp. HP33-1]